MINTETGNKIIKIEAGIYVELDENDEIVNTWTCPDECEKPDIITVKCSDGKNIKIAVPQETKVIGIYKPWKNDPNWGNPMPDHW